MRAVLIVNPLATSTTPPRRDVIVRALAATVGLEVAYTRYRGHATELASAAAADGCEMLFTLGGDGTVNEAVNGLFLARGNTQPGDGQARQRNPEHRRGDDHAAADRTRHRDDADATGRAGGAAGRAERETGRAGGAAGRAERDTGRAGGAAGRAERDTGRAGGAAGRAARETGRMEAATERSIGGTGDAIRPAGRPDPADLPVLVPIPGGSANVFARALGIAADPIDATGNVLAAIREGRQRRISLGLAGDRYFTFSGGLGIDAEVIRIVEGYRAAGRRASPALYLSATVRQFYGMSDRRHPALMLERPGKPPIGPLFVVIVSNTSPWTYLRNRPVVPSPHAGFDTGLDVFAMRRLRTLATLNAVRQMTSGNGRPISGRHVVSLHDEVAVTLRSHRPIACQVDGEYVGEHENMTFRCVPGALRVIA